VINLARSAHTFEERVVLRDISFDVMQGEFFGIIGRNGGGKSTLLKMLAGIYFPTSGSLDVHGAVTPFIELGVGFNPELTGRENVYLNGALFGFDRREMSAMYDDIVAFAELEPFMDLKLKNYSSGMQVRLAFSIAIRSNSEILLVDEVLAVGDAGFQQKCFAHFYELKQTDRTVVFVSHDLDAVERYCDRTIYIEEGAIKAAGNTHEVIDEYSLDVFRRSTDEARHRPRGDGDGPDSAVPGREARMLECVVTPSEVERSTSVTLCFTYEILGTLPHELRFALIKEGYPFAHMSTRGTPLVDQPGRYRAEFTMDARGLLEGQHAIAAGVFHSHTGETFDLNTDLASFYVRGSDPTRKGMMRIEGDWSELPRRSSLAS
jgi:ABC-type polysaccharide/polyol phosphate transport system ATPase subunit